MMTTSTVKEARRAVQQILGANADGNWGERETWPLIRKLGALPGDAAWPPAAPVVSAPLLAGVPADIPAEAYHLILDSEGIDQPFRWPGLDSGISLGPGMDLSAETVAELHEAFDPYLTAEQLARLEKAVGKSGPAAEALAAQYRDIHITREMTDDVFYRVIVPKYYRQMVRAFPGIEKFPGAAQGAVLSCGYNRGWDTRGPRRVEMADIARICAQAGSPARPAEVRAIAAALKSMERLWADNPQSYDDLHDRRGKEEKLCLSALAQ